ncbi:MAG: hypothetical protein HS115_07490 [Spirochaetales bacterium]|nr:hypothetical protein [Spirochaetales bacterium]
MTERICLWALCLSLPLLAQEETDQLARLDVAYARISSGDARGAMTLLEELKTGPFADLARLEIVRLGATLGQKKADLETEMRAIESQEIRDVARLTLVRQLMDRGEDATGLALEATGNQASARLLAAEMYFYRGELKSAERLLLDLRENPQARLLLGRLYLDQRLYSRRRARSVLAELLARENLEPEVRRAGLRLWIQARGFPYSP